MFGVCILRAMYTALTIRDVKRSWYFLKVLKPQPKANVCGQGSDKSFGQRQHQYYALVCSNPLPSYYTKPCQTSDIHPSIGWRCIGSSYFGVTGGRLAIKGRAPVGTRTVSASRACSPATLVKT